MKSMLRQILKILFRNSSHFMYTTAAFVAVKCVGSDKFNTENKTQLKTVDLKTLTHDYMIKQSTLNAVNNASEILTITYTAIEKTSNEYRNLLFRLIGLLKDTIGQEVSDSHWDSIVEIRTRMQDKKQDLTQLINFMETVRKMVESTSEMCYFSGLDNLSSTLFQRINDAMTNIQREVNSNKEIEREYSYIQQQCIIKNENT